MSKILQPTIIDGIKCFSPKVASTYEDYPDSGFDLTDKSSSNSFWVQSRNRLFKSLVKKFTNKYSKTRILEIGCGNGGFISTIAKEETFQITGSEIYLKGLVYAKRNLPEVDFIQIDITEGILDEDFDLILAFDVLEHIENDMDAIANIKNMMTIGGRLIISVPQHMFLWSSLDEIVRHKRRYSRADMVEKLRSSGLEVIFCSSFVFTLFPLMVLSRLLNRTKYNSCKSEEALEGKVSFSAPTNWAFKKIMLFDDLLIRLGVSLPFGGTFIAVAQRDI